MTDTRTGDPAQVAEETFRNPIAEKFKVTRRRKIRFADEIEDAPLVDSEPDERASLKIDLGQDLVAALSAHNKPVAVREPEVELSKETVDALLLHNRPSVEKTHRRSRSPPPHRDHRRRRSPPGYRSHSRSRSTSSHRDQSRTRPTSRHRNHRRNSVSSDSSDEGLLMKLFQRGRAPETVDLSNLPWGERLPREVDGIVKHLEPMTTDRRIRYYRHKTYDFGTLSMQPIWDTKTGEATRVLPDGSGREKAQDRPTKAQRVVSRHDIRAEARMLGQKIVRGPHRSVVMVTEEATAFQKKLLQLEGT